MQGDIVGQGVELMLYGMGTVVVFLALLVVATTLMSRLVSRYFPEPEPLVTTPAAVTPQATPGDDPRLVAVITAAVHRHRARRRD